MPNVSGSSIATPEGGPTPGSAPMRMPTITPAIAIRTLNGVKNPQFVWGLIASLLIGCIQTFAVTLDVSVTSLLGKLGVALNPDVPLISV